MEASVLHTEPFTIDNLTFTKASTRFFL